MERQQLEKILKQVRSGKLGVKGALECLKLEALDQLSFATLDIERAIRRGFPEVVYGPGKTVDQIVTIVERLMAAKQTVLVTRVGSEVFDAVASIAPSAEHHALARAVVVRCGGRRRVSGPGVTVVSAGTADLPVAEEAALTAEVLGSKVQRICDVGVAGLHRLLQHKATLIKARVIVAVAGMDGVLPTVVAGLSDCPVIGVPTSNGYGTGTGGLAALNTMLNSCAAGVTVVNIDNGFGAGYAAAMIDRGK